MTKRTPIWMAIANTLRSDIADGIYAASEKLPTEATLAAKFGVNRHTVRHALKTLSDEGLTYARRGSGVFVATTPTDYPIGRRVRFSQNLEAAGRTPAKEVLLLETRTARPHELDILQLNKGAQVHVFEGLSLADGNPIGMFRSVFPAESFPSILNDLRDTGSVSEALSRAGIDDYTRASTRVNAKLASATQALHLRIAEHAPLLRTTAVNVDPNGTPIEFGLTWFAGDLVTLTLAGDDI